MRVVKQLLVLVVLLIFLAAAAGLALATTEGTTSTPADVVVTPGGDFTATASAVELNATITVTCAATMSGTLEVDGNVTIDSFVFSSCSSGCTVTVDVTSPIAIKIGKLTATVSTGSTSSTPAATTAIATVDSPVNVTVTCLFVTCTFAATPPDIRLTGHDGEPAEIVFDDEPFEGSGGLCGVQGTMSGTFAVADPQLVKVRPFTRQPADAETGATVTPATEWTATATTVGIVTTAFFVRCKSHLTATMNEDGRGEIQSLTFTECTDLSHPTWTCTVTASLPTAVFDITHIRNTFSRVEFGEGPILEVTCTAGGAVQLKCTVTDKTPPAGRITDAMPAHLRIADTVKVDGATETGTTPKCQASTGRLIATYTITEPSPLVVGHA